MSRLEKTLEKKTKNRKLRMISKIIFIFFLILNTTICVCIVDFNAKKMLGQEKEIKYNINKIQIYLNSLVSNIEDISLDIKEQFNNNKK